VTVHLPPTDVGAVIALLTLLAGYIPDRPRLTKPPASDVTRSRSRHGDTPTTRAHRNKITRGSG
jgi:hypothetical protein